ncbi:MAG TPA: hypothetical protein VMU25_01355 [Candidatus Paceibacterota bacterium]|nr:hypothetical protein [Candidatus Paceibacterota bacterium]
MDLSVFLNELVSFLLQLLTLFITFWISVLELILHFAQTIAGQR